MKKKNAPTQPLTKADLASALTKYATKEELKTEIRLSAEETVRKLEETIVDVKDILLTTMDSFAKDIESNREDRDLAIHQASQLQGQVDGHEKRIKHLEKVQQI